MPGSGDREARELIERFGDALRALNDGKAVPIRWRKWIETALGPKLKRGTSPNSYVQQRNARWNDAMLEAEIARGRGQEPRGATQVATDLARMEAAGRRDGALSAADVFKAQSRRPEGGLRGADAAFHRRLIAKLDAGDEPRQSERAAERRKQAKALLVPGTSRTPPKTRK